MAPRTLVDTKALAGFLKEPEIRPLTPETVIWAAQLVVRVTTRLVSTATLFVSAVPKSGPSKTKVPLVMLHTNWRFAPGVNVPPSTGSALVNPAGRTESVPAGLIQIRAPVTFV